MADIGWSGCQRTRASCGWNVALQESIGQMELLFAPMGHKGGQQAGAITTETKHRNQESGLRPCSGGRSTPPATVATSPGNQWHNSLCPARGGAVPVRGDPFCPSHAAPPSCYGL